MRFRFQNRRAIPIVCEEELSFKCTSWLPLSLTAPFWAEGQCFIPVSGTTFFPLPTVLLKGGIEVI